MTAIGGAIGFAMSLPLPKVFGAMFFDLHVNEPRLYFVVPIVVLIVACLASYIPARRAARLDPIHALRQD
jgi:ABC-type antimicrobial peptide transport system permease subunit